jgi:hypothetical protein
VPTQKLINSPKSIRVHRQRDELGKYGSLEEILPNVERVMAIVRQQVWVGDAARNHLSKTDYLIQMLVYVKR